MGAGLAGETLGKGGRVAAEAWNAASFFSKPESSQGEGRKKKTTGKKKVYMIKLPVFSQK